MIVICTIFVPTAGLLHIHYDFSIVLLNVGFCRLWIAYIKLLLFAEKSVVWSAIRFALKKTIIFDLVGQLWAPETTSKWAPIDLTFMSWKAPLVMILILKQVWSLLVAEKSYVKIMCATLGALRRSPRVKRQKSLGTMNETTHL